jgi:hypothetical protein
MMLELQDLSPLHHPLTCVNSLKSFPPSHPSHLSTYISPTCPNRVSRIASFSFSRHNAFGRFNRQGARTR